MPHRTWMSVEEYFELDFEPGEDLALTSIDVHFPVDDIHENVIFRSDSEPSSE
jgi:hypothetical protein